jgi:dipeptidyl aminopeptidase/acylaminoacyl peptidase
MGAPAIWRGMTRAELDAAYNNGAAVADSAAIVDAWIERSARLRQRHPDDLDLVYGPRPRNRIDLFRCGEAGAPLFLFIHGGYWQHRAKDVFSFLAAGPMQRGFDVAMLGYTLAPEVRVGEIVAEAQAAVRWLRGESARLAAGGGRLLVGGWSAGGHLAAMTMGMAEVDGGLAISGIYDLEPCRLSYLNEKLRLTPGEVAQVSPIRHIPERAGPLLVAYGTGELAELQRQSRDYWQAWRRRHGGRLVALPGDNHFSVLEKLADPCGTLAEALASLVRSP